jgi:hypothetical protein
LYISIHFYP